VAALATDLEACFEDPEFAATTERLRGTVGLSAAGTPQSATVRLADGEVSLAHGLAADADVTATLARRAAEALTGREEHPELAAWVERLCDPPRPDWDDAAARFWSVLSGMRGAPDGLRVVERGGGEERTFGADDGRYEIEGRAEDLVEVLTGRASLFEAAYEGTVFIRGSFPQVSVLAGAGFALRQPDGAAGG
jgi:hypothetical protein